MAEAPTRDLAASPYGPILNSRFLDLDEHFHASYATRFGVLAGYLPQDAPSLHKWIQEIAEAAPPVPEGQVLQPSVQALAVLIRDDSVVRMYVTEMINQVPKKLQTVSSIPDLLRQLNYIVTLAPKFNPVHSVAFPMSALFVYMMWFPAGESAFRNAAFNDAIRGILQEWCAFLDSPASTSVLTTKPDGWLSPLAWKQMQLDQFIIPPDGFQSYNAYFHREIKPEARPLQGQGDASVVVSANDGTLYNTSHGVKLFDEFWAKSQPYSLFDMLDGAHPPVSGAWSPEDFVGGDVMQSFLSGADYHRWRAPVSGTVIETRVIDGLQFSELTLGPKPDPTSGTYSQGYQASVNTRGLVIIESPVVGKVCVIPIGITEISSISITINVGDVVAKGDELGFFSYGGSTLALVFQKDVINHFTVTNDPSKMKNPDDGTKISALAQIAVANVTPAAASQ